MNLLSAIYSAFQVIGLLDKWAERSLTSYRAFKREKQKQEIASDLKKAHADGNIQELQRTANGDQDNK